MLQVPKAVPLPRDGEVVKTVQARMDTRTHISLHRRALGIAMCHTPPTMPAMYIVNIDYTWNDWTPSSIRPPEFGHECVV